MENKSDTSHNPAVPVEKDCDVYCPVCRKLLHVEKGQIIPRCCGKQM